MNNSAVLSTDGVYRYTLARGLDNGPHHKGVCLFIMLNPSTADANINDPTITRCIRFARDWGYGELLVGNLFAFRATLPSDLIKTKYPVGSDNDAFLSNLASRADLIVCAWGTHGVAYGRGLFVSDFLSIKGYNLYCIPGPDNQPLLTANRQPRHPLYLKAERTPERFLTPVA